MGAVHYNNSIHINQPTVADVDGLQRSIQEAQNSRLYTTTGGLPEPSVGAP